ncbi:Ankyrin repeat domain-containing protein 1 [Durusdinium trenchii]|uniref:Ankyrin repeat domain-containing protein 1 n=1 Tax=Durusdinium trenchii TaxID=1381693 RepID=A0ABP0J9B6_9DINO
MAEVEKDRVRAESGKPDMEEKVKKMMELNELREKWSDKLFQDNPDSVNSFMVTMDENNMPAIEIGVDPSASQESLAVPEELFSENLIFRTVERMRDAGPLILDLEDGQVVDVLQAADGANARLLHSASLADWPGVRLALEQCAFVNTRDADHRTAISWAASFGAADIIRLLVKQKAQVGMMDAFGWQPFHFAVSGRHVEATALLFHANAALDVETFEGDSPLQMAIQADDASLVQMLLACSAQVDRVDWDDLECEEDQRLLAPAKACEATAQVDGANLQLTQLATLRGCAGMPRTQARELAVPLRITTGRITVAIIRPL